MVMRAYAQSLAAIFQCDFQIYNFFFALRKKWAKCNTLCYTSHPSGSSSSSSRKKARDGNVVIHFMYFGTIPLFGGEVVGVCWPLFLIFNKYIILALIYPA